MFFRRDRFNPVDRSQRGFSIPAAIFVLVIVAILGGAMVSVLNQGQLSVAREAISIRALMAAESGAERGLQTVLEVNPAACTGDMSNPPTSFAALISGWNPAPAALAGCTVNVSCGVVAVDANNDGSSENYFTLRSSAACGPVNDQAFRIVQVQATD
ncbi:MAG: hypothetical protein KJP25_05660 [Gammaproteobacteria bacterium]|nr:hypothetical protein [Gammaproteobacteria bacterium]NND39985.1 hypothetical protein [Pseudomonadales bacterium]MBT8151413.1 hypothetical protein [Gammaproteobacteria bacterium]NNL10823.1 hypothetical protein [Pseudomonadales bacterium]NNM10986.1 hypothetical protein [Pseudomonadales bacterium]